jgi:hypothetical protein
MNRRNTVLIIAVIASAVALWWWHSQGEVAAWSPALSSRAAATRVLAEHLARRYPGSKALVFGNPFSQRPGQTAEIYAFEKASVRGLEQGFGSPDSLAVVYPELRPEFFQRPESVYVDPKTTTPLSFLVADEAFDRLAQANSGCSLVISLIGLPVNIRQSRVWRESDKPRFGLLLPDWRMVGGRAAIREALKSEKIAAAVIGRPGASSSDTSVERDYRAEFSRRFLLVTKENIDELLHQYPQVF